MAKSNPAATRSTSSTTASTDVAEVLLVTTVPGALGALSTATAAAERFVAANLAQSAYSRLEAAVARGRL